MRQIILIAACCSISLYSVAAKKIKAYKTLPSDTLRVRDYLIRSKLYQINKPALAIKLAKEALIYSKKTNFILGEARSLNQIAALNEHYHSIAIAIHYQKQAVALLAQIPGDEAEIASGYLKLGVFEEKKKDLKAAIVNITSALKIYQKLQLNRGIFLCYTNLGHVKEMAGESHASLQFYLKARELGKSHPFTGDYLMLLEHLGGIYFKMDSNDRALQVYQEGIKESQQKPAHLPAHLSFLRKTGMIHNMLGDKTKALEFHRLALAKAGKSGLPEEQARSLVNMANILKDQNTDQSLGHLNKALSIAQQIGNKTLAAEIYHSLSDIYRQQDKFKEALLTLEAHHDLLDSMITINKVHETEITKGNYELERSRTDIQQLEFSNERRTLERNAGLFIMLVTLLVLGSLIYHFYKTKILNKTLSESNLVKDKLFSIIGHDLRNPIGGITTMLSLMENKNHDAEVIKRVSAMRKQGELALEILNSLLKWGQAQLKGIEVKSADFRTKDFIQKNIALLKSQSLEKQITIENQIPDDLIINADPDHFDFIIRNLLSNAIKFSFTEGKIELISKTDIKNQKVIFSIKDYGQGISENQLKKFKYGNIDISYGTSGEKGTGIGLMLCREFIKANGGEIWIESTEGKGAVFNFSFRKGGA
jgi:signal transduction histidine kinase